MSGAAEPGVRACTAGRRRPAPVSLRPRDALVHSRLDRGGLAQREAWLIAYVVAGAFDGKGLPQLSSALVVLVAVVLARAAVSWAAELIASRSSTRVKQQLRAALLGRVAALGPGRLGEDRTGEIATLATRGIDALDGYFSLYLPQLFLAVIVPLTVVAVVLAGDWISAVIIAFTLPLIPVFMALVGAATVKCVAGAGLTAIMPLVPVMALETVSAAFNV